MAAVYIGAIKFLYEMSYITMSVTATFNAQNVENICIQLWSKRVIFMSFALC